MTGNIRIEVEVDTDEVDRDLDRVVRGPGRVAHLHFDQILSGQFGRAYAAVHVLTGALKMSGDQDSHALFAGGWEGEISFGGDFVMELPGGGHRAPGEYAFYEFDKPFDGSYDHNWIRGSRLREDESDYAEAITDWMREGAG